MNLQPVVSSICMLGLASDPCKPWMRLKKRNWVGRLFELRTLCHSLWDFANTASFLTMGSVGFVKPKMLKNKQHQLATTSSRLIVQGVGTPRSPTGLVYIQNNLTQCYSIIILHCFSEPLHLSLFRILAWDKFRGCTCQWTLCLYILRWGSNPWVAFSGL